MSELEERLAAEAIRVYRRYATELVDFCSYLQLTRLAVLEKIRRGTPKGAGFFDPDAMDSGDRALAPARLAVAT